MSDTGDNARHDAPPTSRPVSWKARPRTQAPESLLDHNSGNSGNSKKLRKRSPPVVSIPSEKTILDQSPSHIAPSREGSEKVLIETPTASAEKTEQARDSSKLLAKDVGSQANSPLPEPDSASDTSKLGFANESEGSSGSNETVTHISPVRRDSSGKVATLKPRKHHINKPNPLSFLDTDSPQLTSESIQRTVKEASKASPDTAKNTSPSAHSTLSTSSGPRDDLFDVLGDHETDRSTSPERSINGDPRGRAAGDAGPRVMTGKGRRRSYGTPEMPRGNVQYPHVPPEDLTPRAINPHFMKHLPRHEKPPMTGYELLASKLSATSVYRSGTPLRPIYRRFETLNHRVLLHLQDEICELEEQLRRLDAVDTQNRRLPNGVLPASRRAESMSNSELQWHKTDTLGKVGFKLEQYSRVLSSFRETLSLSAPSPADIHEYRGFLSSYAPIAETETQFLDATDDLVYVGYSDEDMVTNEEDVITPVSRSDITDFQSRRRVSILSQSDASRRYDERSTPSPDQGVATQGAVQYQHAANKQLLTHLSIATAAAITLPILTFLVIPGFIGRMTVACLVGIGILGALVQGKVVKFQASQQLFVSVGLYGGVMALLAGMVN
ncbi:hypothetical protein E0Z10_g4944 [Xylaria hypoxylon]|uniref:DUF6594 domain-containing protein n=1 Tax=Xylaria hypoxylon TaxID=37992 RepID=A0A4Z0YIS0_9PEZI|nr:hypothetical protein E0Z10_g4944 [Xylaria hypoxylon]